jgi:hypothetical protein
MMPGGATMRRPIESAANRYAALAQKLEAVRNRAKAPSA